MNMLSRLRLSIVTRGYRSFGEGSSIGRGVRSLNRGQISIGEYSRIDDGVYLNGLSQRGLEIGDRCQIRYGTFLDCWKGLGISIGSDTYIGPMCIIQGQGGTRIGSNCLIAGHTYIVPSNHVFSSVEKPIRRQGETRRGIEIGDDVWLGAGTKVLDGVTVGQGSVIGAGSVVTRDIPDFSVAYGVPARVARKREEESA